MVIKKASTLMLCKNKMTIKNNNANGCYKKQSLKSLTRMDKIKLIICFNKPNPLAFS